MSRAYLQDKQRVVIKIGTSTITHTDTGHLNLVKLEKFMRILTYHCVFRSNRSRKKGTRYSGKALHPANETGLCSSWTGEADDDLSEAFCRI